MSGASLEKTRSDSESKVEDKGQLEISSKQGLSTQVFEQMERRDEDQILAEMRGELIEELVYSADIQGRRVTNLSIAGVKEAIRRRGNVEILDVKIEETEQEIRALVKVRDLDNRIDVLGASSAEKAKPFSFVLAVNKAERNAFAKLLPIKLYATLIQDWLEKHRQRSPAQGVQEAQAPQQAVASPHEGWEIRVPLVKEIIQDASINQTPMLQGTLRVGMLNVLVDMTECSIVPEGPISKDDSLIARFLEPKVLQPMVEKHAGFEYQILSGEDGNLKAIVLRGPLNEQMLKDLSNASKWAFSRAMEKTKPN